MKLQRIVDVIIFLQHEKKTPKARFKPFLTLKLSFENNILLFSILEALVGIWKIE